MGNGGRQRDGVEVAAKHNIDTMPCRQHKGAGDPGRTTGVSHELAHLRRCSGRGRSEPWQDKNI
jgi:hypothetical protein